MKQKECFTPSELPHQWAHQLVPHGRVSGGSTRFDGPSFYSYATVIARIIEHRGRRAFVVDSCQFSVTTSKHLRGVRNSIPEKERIFYVYSGKRGQSLQFTPQTLRDHYWLAYSKTPELLRLEHQRASQLLGRRYNLQNAIEVCEFFGLGVAKLKKEMARMEPEFRRAHEIVTAYEAKLKQRREAREAKENAERVKIAIGHAEDVVNGRLELREDYRLNLLFGYDLKYLETRPDLKSAILKIQEGKARELIDKWRLGENVEISNSNLPVYLRAKDGVMETSRGVRVPIDEAHNAFRFVMLKRSTGWHRNGETFAVSGFQLEAVNEQGVVAGCHRIAWDEIERFAKTQGWIK